MRVKFAGLLHVRAVKRRGFDDEASADCCTNGKREGLDKPSQPSRLFHCLEKVWELVARVPKGLLR